jgi:hypothetical protein
MMLLSALRDYFEERAFSKLSAWIDWMLRTVWYPLKAAAAVAATVTTIATAITSDFITISPFEYRIELTRMPGFFKTEA